MSKRKFNIKSLFSGRPNKATKPSETGEPAAWASDSESDDHFDPAAVDRPPPLDDRTEMRLREACATIVENLKPSGYDIEDTRMKNDIYVDDLSDQDEPPVTNTQSRSHKQYKQPTTWFEDGSDRNSSILQHHDVHDSSEKRRPATLAERESYHAKRRREHQHVSNMLRAQQESESDEAPYQVESPIAPAATARRRSRIDTVPKTTTYAPEQARQTSGVRNASSSTMSTQYTASTNGVHSVSTGVTSTAQTPASTSKRTSDHAKADYPTSAPPAAAAGPWMKEEVDRRKHVESASYAPQAGYESGVTDDTTQSVHGYLQAQAVPIVYSRASNMTSPTRDRDARSGSRSPSTGSPPSKPRFVIEDDDAVATTSPPQHELEQSEHAPPRRPSSDYGDENIEDQRGTESNGVQIPELQISPSPLQSPDPDVGDAPVTPAADAFDKTMANIRARMAATSLSSHPVHHSQPTSPGLEADFRQHPALGPIHSMNDSEPPQLKRQANLPTVPNRGSSSFTQVPRMPPIPGKHQFGGSVIIKDFAQTSSDRAQHNAGTQNDVDAVGFDSFMNVVDQVNSPTSPTFSSRHQNPPVVPPDPPRLASSKSDAGPRPKSALSMNGGSRPKSPRSAVSFAAGTAGPKSAMVSLASSEPPQSPSRFNLNSPPIPPIPPQLPASLNRRYSPATQSPTIQSPPSPGPPRPQEPASPSVTERTQDAMSTFEHLKSQNPPNTNHSLRPMEAPSLEPNLSALPSPSAKTGFMRVEPHPAYASSSSVGNGVNGHQPNGSMSSAHNNYSNYSQFAPMSNGTTTKNSNEASSITSKPKSTKSVKSPSRLSISSRASSRNHATSATAHQTAPLPPPPVPQPVHANGTTPTEPSTSKSGPLKSWLTRRRSRSFSSHSPRSNGMNPYMNGGANGYTFADANGLPGKSVNGNSTCGDGNPMGGFAYYHATQDDDYEDPLVCAAPVVAFGRGW